MIRFFSRAFLLSLSCCVLVFLTASPALAADVPSTKYSTISLSKKGAKADGIDGATVSVTVKNSNMLALRGIAVKLVSSRGAMDEIIEEEALTNSIGKARFLVKSLKNGTSTLTAIAAGVTLPQTVEIRFSSGLALLLNPGDLVKIPDDGDGKTLSDTAVYYFASNGKRYVFPNEKVYFTWYKDFGSVKIIPIDQMSLIPIGGNVTYHPATRLVKFQTDTKTYLVTRGGVLRWIKTEDVPRGWYGTDWNKMVDDISEAFYVNYTFGEPVSDPLEVAVEQLRLGTSTIERDKGLVAN